MKSTKSLAACALALALAGCDNPPTPNAASAPAASAPTNATAAANATAPRKPSVRYDALRPEDAVMTVDGRPLTKAAIENECGIQVVLAALANRKLTVEQSEKIRVGVRNRARKNFLLQQALLKEAARRGLTVSDDEYAAFCTNFTKRLTRQSKKMTFPQVLGRLSAAEAQSLKDTLRADCLVQKVRQALREESRVAVTKEEAARRFRLIESYNAKARAKEKEIYASATNTWKRLTGGEPFEALVDELQGEAPEIDADREWGTFQRGFFKEDKNVYEALGKLGPGEFTPPIEGNGGLILFQVVDVQPPTEDAAAGGDFYQLAKIFYALPVVYDLTDVDALQARLMKEMSDEKLQGKLNALQLACKVEHPNGAVNMNTAKQPGGRK